MRKRLIAFALCLATSCVLLAGCGGSGEKPADVEQTAEEKVSLTQMASDSDGYSDYIQLDEQNYCQNSNTFLVKDGWIYGESWNDDGNCIFVKTRTDMTDWTVLDTGYVSRITIIDNYIYYMMNRGDGKTYGIYRMKTSGEGKKLLVKAYGSMQIADDHIYYVNQMHNGKYSSAAKKKSQCHLFRCNLNGKKRVEIISKPTFHSFVFSDGILYQDDRDNMSLHICDLSGGNDFKLNDAHSFWPLYDGEYIYYVCEEKDGKDKSRTIRRMKSDGTDDQEVSSCSVSNNMLLTAGEIYFTYADDSDRLYKISKDGSGLTLVTQDKYINDVCLFESSITYQKCTKGYKYSDGVFFCDLDGSGKKKFEKQ